MDGLGGLFVPKQQKSPLSKTGEKILSSPELASVSGEVQKAIQALEEGNSKGKVLLVIDQLDLLLAAGGNGIGAVNLGEVLMGWREVCNAILKHYSIFLISSQDVHATVLALSADLPLVATQRTPLEVDHAAFLLSAAHDADFTMGLRLLDTGTARDVSGVVRITVNDAAAEEERDGHRRIEERELLYFVGGDGGVRVFERGQ